MIVFKKIRWKNFLSTGNLFTELTLNNFNNTLIVGENGSGKSTFLDALTFSLFGKPFRKINKPQLINSITKKEAVVEIEFSIGTSDYKIIRGLKPSVFEVYQNGNLLNQSAEMKDYQEILEKQILKISYKSFCQVVVLGSASFVPFMQLPSGQRREIIEDLLDLEIFTIMNTLLKDKIASNNEQLINVNAERKIVEEKIKMIKEHLIEMQNNNEKIIEEKLERIEETDKQIKAEKIKYDNMSTRISQIDYALKDEESFLKKANKLQSLKHQIEAKIATLNNDVNFFKNHDNCPTCQQAIESGFKAEVIEKKQSEINTTESGLSQLIEQYEVVATAIGEYRTLKDEVMDLQMQQYRIRSSIESLQKYYNQLVSEVESINKQQEKMDDDKIAELEIETKTVEEKFNQITERKQILAAASTLLKDGGIKAKIIKQYIPIINKLINKYLSAMDFFVQFELDEEFNETIKSRFRDEFSYASFSEGEKMRINLAILFTWRAVAKLRNSVNTNLLIMDEVFDSSLDTNGTEEFLKILNGLTQDTNTFIISHKGDQLFDKFANVIKFEKHKNFSRMV